MDCWEILGVPSTATVDEVKLAYKQKATGAHPDVGGSVQEFTRVNLAYRQAVEVASRPLMCERCRGVGTTKRTINWVTTLDACESCGGTGSIKR